MERAVLEDVVLEYETAGQGEPVLLIHGALIADSFRPLLGASELTERYGLIAYRRRGYGGSTPAMGPLFITQQAKDCRSLLNYLGAAPAHVVGHSYGGAIAEARTTFEVEGPAHADWSFGEAEARRIQHPALVVLGEESRTLSPRFEETYDSLLAWLPGAEGFVLPTAAHGLHLQNLAGMVRRLRAFLELHPIA